jgi:hypothetical protein
MIGDDRCAHQPGFARDIMIAIAAMPITDAIDREGPQHLDLMDPEIAGQEGDADR